MYTPNAQTVILHYNNQQLDLLLRVLVYYHNKHLTVLILDYNYVPKISYRLRQVTKRAITLHGEVRLCLISLFTKYQANTITPPAYIKRKYVL